MIILLILTLLTFGGMFYWMYKSRKGELNLSKTSIHIRFIKWMWDVDYWEIENACPYYWSLVFSILILPLYLIGRYIIYPICKYILVPIIEYTQKKLNWLLFSKKFKTKLLNKINLPTPNESYKQIYKKGKQWTEYIFIILLGLITLGSVIIGFIMSFQFNLIFGITFLSGLIFIIGTWVISKLYPQLDKYHIDHYLNFISGLWGIIKLPFVILAGLFELILNKISNSCPPINWN